MGAPVTRGTPPPSSTILPPAPSQRSCLRNGSCGRAGLTRIRAPMAWAPAGPTAAGLSSSSPTAGRSSASSDTRSSRSASAAVPTGVIAPCPDSSGAARPPANQLVRVGVRERGEYGHAVTEHPAGHTAQAEHHQRAEHGFLDDSHRHLGSRLAAPGGRRAAPARPGSGSRAVRPRRPETANRRLLDKEEGRGARPGVRGAQPGQFADMPPLPPPPSVVPSGVAERPGRTLRQRIARDGRRDGGPAALALVAGQHPHHFRWSSRAAASGLATRAARSAGLRSAIPVGTATASTASTSSWAATRSR
jgi:hypothetical protein